MPEKVAHGDLSAAAGLALLLSRHVDRQDNGLFPAAAIAPLTVPDRNQWWLRRTLPSPRCGEPATERCHGAVATSRCNGLLLAALLAP